MGQHVQSCAAAVIRDPGFTTSSPILSVVHTNNPLLGVSLAALFGGLEMVLVAGLGPRVNVGSPVPALPQFHGRLLE